MFVWFEFHICSFTVQTVCYLEVRVVLGVPGCPHQDSLALLSLQMDLREHNTFTKRHISLSSVCCLEMS